MVSWAGKSVDNNVKLLYPAIIMSQEISMSNIDKICPLAILNFISMHVPSLVKIPRHLLQLAPGNKNISVSQADNTVKI